MTLNPPALRKLLANGVQLRPFSNDIMVACYKAAEEVFGKSGLTGARMDDYLALRSVIKFAVTHIQHV